MKIEPENINKIHTFIYVEREIMEGGNLKVFFNEYTLLCLFVEGDQIKCTRGKIIKIS